MTHNVVPSKTSPPTITTDATPVHDPENTEAGQHSPSPGSPLEADVNQPDIILDTNTSPNIGVSPVGEAGDSLSSHDSNTPVQVRVGNFSLGQVCWITTYVCP